MINNFSYDNKSWLFVPWEQRDWSIIDLEWNIITKDERGEIIKSIYNLPIHSKIHWDKIAEIRDCVGSELVAFIWAKTWSGKTTEIPKVFIWWWKKIIVSETRVIACIWAANFTSSWLLATTGNPEFTLWHRVWYRTWRESRSFYDSDLLYVTDWLQLLRHVWGLNPDLLIADEIHTSTIPTEFLLKLYKDFALQQLKKNVADRTKLVLMSADIDEDLFRDYFKEISSNVNFIYVEWRPHNLTREYLGGWEFLYSIINRAKNNESILAFVEWKKMIEATIEELKMHLSEDKFDIFPLHSELPIEEQNWLLNKNSDKTVVVVATNVAQESLTIPYMDWVVDNWFKKEATVNSCGVTELRRVSISKSDSNQRWWRVGRTKPGTYTYTNDTPLDQLRDFPAWEIENATLEKYILISLSTWFNPLKELKWELVKDPAERKRIFIHEPNIDLVQLSYDNLIKIWAITPEHTLTRLWRELLNLPLDPYIGKMLRESFRLDCSWDMIDICAIINHKWFLGKIEYWKDFVNMKHKKHSDLIAQREMFNFVTTREPLRDIDYVKLLEYWISRQELDLFKEYSKNWKEKMLFELVDLTEIWVKQKKIHEILSTINILKDRLESSWLIITYRDPKNKWDIKRHYDNIIKSILHWIPNYLFDWVEESKMFHNIEMKDFIKPNTSVIIPDENCTYIWFPFIIWWTDGNEDAPLLLFVTKVDEAILNDVIYLHTDLQFKDIDFWVKNLSRSNKWRKLEPRIMNNLMDDLGWMSLSNLIEEIPKEKLRDVSSFLWLPEFLIQNNKSIKKLIAAYSWSWKWEFNMVRFSHILKIFIPRLIERFKMDNIAETLAFYKDDKCDLFDTIRHSNDPRVVEFFSNPYKRQYDTMMWDHLARNMQFRDLKYRDDLLDIEETIDKKFKGKVKKEQVKKNITWEYQIQVFLAKKRWISRNKARELISNWMILINWKKAYLWQVFNPSKDKLDEIRPIVLTSKEKVDKIITKKEKTDNPNTPKKIWIIKFLSKKWILHTKIARKYLSYWVIYIDWRPASIWTDIDSDFDVTRITIDREKYIEQEKIDAQNKPSKLLKKFEKKPWWR